MDSSSSSNSNSNSSISNMSSDSNIAVHTVGRRELSAFQAFLIRVYGQAAASQVTWDGGNADGSAKGDASWFELRVSGDVLEVAADGILSACSAVNYYCATAGMCSVSWGQTAKPRLPSPLAPLQGADETGTVVSRVILRTHILLLGSQCCN
jgi:hypothetical protein